MTVEERLLAQERLILDTTELFVGLLQQQSVSRQELSRRLKVSKGFVSQVLSGERNMTLRTLANFASALGVTIDILCSESNQSEIADGINNAHDEMQAKDASQGDELVPVVEYCREWPSHQADRCNKRAEFLLWGKLFPAEALGPRCYACASKYVPERDLCKDTSHALLDLRGLMTLVSYTHPDASLPVDADPDA